MERHPLTLGDAGHVAPRHMGEVKIMAGNAATHPEVEVVERRGMHRDADLAGARLGEGEVEDRCGGGAVGRRDRERARDRARLRS